MQVRKKKESVGMGQIPTELVVQAKAGDQAAFAELYELTSTELYRSVRSMVRDEDLAWDILQDSYVRAWRGMEKLETSESFLPWLRRIAVNVTATQMAQKRPLTFTELASDEDDREPDIPDLSIDAQPELALDRKETSRLVREILAGLPEEQQLIVGMHYYEDMPIKEIADTLRISVGAVKAQLFRGRKKVEAGVRDLEKKGVKLYSLSPIPFLMALLRRLEPAVGAEKKALAAVLAEASSAGAARTVTAVTASQAFLHGLGVKLLVGGVAVAMLVGGKLGYDALKNRTVRNVDDPLPAQVETTTEATDPEPATTLPEQMDASDPTAPTAPPVSSVPFFSAPAPAGAEYAGDCGLSLRWRFDPEAGILNLEGSGTMYDYGSRATFAADAPWASYRAEISEVQLPEGITSIGAEAFRGCGALTAVTIPQGVTVIGDGAFSGCESLAAATIPQGVTVIGNAAFSGCKGLTEVTLPKGVVSIGDKAFYACEGLRTAALPDSVTYLGASAFAECGGLVSAVLPRDLAELPEGVFAGCGSLSFLRLPEGTRAIGSRAFRGCGELTAVVIPEDMRTIGSNAFADCGGLSSAVILDRLVDIDDDAFNNWENLTIYGYPYSTASVFASENNIPFQSLDDLGETPIPGYRVELSFLNEADSSWKAETIREETWTVRVLDLYQDGSLWYREGELASRYSLYLDGVWQAEEDGTLLLTLWKSPYNSWSRPADYRVTAADAPADSRTARFSCQRTENGLVLRQQYAQGFADDAPGTRLEFREAELAVPTVSAEELRAREEESRGELERLTRSQNLDLTGCGTRISIEGVARAGERFAAKVVCASALTVSEAELSRAAQTTRITLRGQEYAYGANAEGPYGRVYRLRPNGRVNWSDWYAVKRVEGRCFFVREEGGEVSRIESAPETCWLWLEPETPITVNSDEANLPQTLEAWGVVRGEVCFPLWEETTGELYLWIDPR